jgi:hypothetical protein
MAYQRDDADRMMDELTRPFYVLRMARAKLETMDSGHVIYNSGMAKSAQSSADKAKREIWKIIWELV